MKDILGVTIAVGAEYERLAAQAAERFRRFTGCDAVILGENEFREAGCRHPSQLKFRLFDLLSAEHLIYFDADAFFLQSWDVRQCCDTPALQCVRAFWFDPWVERVGRLYGFEDRVLCSGLFLANRTHHAAAFRLAEQIQPADDEFHGHFNAEEIALSIALNTLGVPIQFLDRRFNWVQYGRGTLADQADVVVAHACSSELRRQFLAPGWELKRPTGAKSSTVPAPQDDRTYIYDRIGYDLRPLTLRPDGTIGANGGWHCCRFGPAVVLWR
jgi:hypothetical protein